MMLDVGSGGGSLAFAIAERSLIISYEIINYGIVSIILIHYIAPCKTLAAMLT